MSQKHDSFQPRRATTIDGFFSGAGQQPRQSQFRAKPTQAQQPLAPQPTAKSQPGLVSSQAMPRRPIQSAVRATAEPLPTPQSTYPLDGSRPAAQTRPTPEALPKPKKQSWRARRKAAKRAKAAQHSQARGGKKRTKRVIKILGLLLLLTILAFGARFYKDIARLTGNSNPFSLIGVFRPADLKNENGRVNVLVAGNSADDLGHNGGELTDSIMVLSLNTKNNTAMMLSIPRDLWVNIPGYGHAKINAAFPNGGMDTLKDVVEENLELPIHYTALINYSAFRDLVNAVGGITIHIQSEDSRGIYDPSLDWTSARCCALAKYPNGSVNLNGKQALNLARARGDAYGSYGFPQADFNRTEHQRQMLLAIKDKASSPAVIANPFKISNLVAAVGNNARTDLQLNEMQTLYYYMKKVENNKIDSYNINTLKGDDVTMLQNFTSADGQSALAPAAGVDDFSEIAAQIKRLFTASPLVKENASVVVLNATETSGLATQHGGKLQTKGINIVGKADAPVNQAQNTLIDNSLGKKPNTLTYLKSTYGATVVVDRTLTARYPSADFILILGETSVPKPATPKTGQ